MSISASHTDKNADRVCTHKCAFTTARTISLGAGLMENSTPSFSRSEAITLSKYSLHAFHHVLILRIVLSSQMIPTSLPSMICSIVSALYRLYGITMSGNSWCIFLHCLQRKRRIIKTRTVSFPVLIFRLRLPATFIAPLHTGHMLLSSLQTKRSLPAVLRSVPAYDHHALHHLRYAHYIRLFGRAQLRRLLDFFGRR